MTKIEKAKEFVKTHKKEIAVGALGVATTVIGMVLFKNRKVSVPEENEVVKVLREAANIVVKDIAIPENLKTCNMTSLWKEGDCINAIVNDVYLYNMGEFGNELINNLDVNHDIPVDMVIGFLAN